MTLSDGGDHTGANLLSLMQIATSTPGRGTAAMPYLTLPRFCRHLNNPGSRFRAEVCDDIEAQRIPVRGRALADAAAVHAGVQAGGGAVSLEWGAAAGGGGAAVRHPGRHAAAVAAAGGG